jgi:hypothetical protein
MTTKARLPKGYLDMVNAEYADLDVETQRAVFSAMRDIIGYNTDHAMGLIEMAGPTTPVGWIMAAKGVHAKCSRCKGSGIYSWGACVNGKMSCSGKCNRCQGKGYMDFPDMRRNKAYDKYAIRRAFSA